MLEISSLSLGVLVGIVLVLIWQKMYTRTPNLEIERSIRLDNHFSETKVLLNAVDKDVARLVDANKHALEINRSIHEIQSMLKVPKSRGIHGECLLEQQLSRLPKDHFEMQYRFKSGSICDAIVLLRDDLILPIDSKFPLENFRGMINASSDMESKEFEKKFRKDVKKHISDISGKYIFPAEGTLDIALMYIPAENIYYHTFINDNSDESLFDYAFNNKVIPVSPNSLSAYLEIVLFGLRGLKIEASAHKIRQGLLDIQNSLGRFSEAYNTAKNQLRNAQNNFEEVGMLITDVRAKVSDLSNQDGQL